MYGGITRLSCRGSNDMWFDLMDQYGDLGKFLSVLSMMGIILYFVTSSDSGSLVIDCLSANGHPDPPIIQRIFWALTEGATATALLKAGGTKALSALQTASVTAGLPYTFILNWTCVAMWRAVQVEAGEIQPSDGKWYMSVWDLNSCERFVKLIINLFCPWFYLGKSANRMSASPSLRKQISHSIVFAVLFYLWIILMICEEVVADISYVGWAMLIAFFAYAGGVRGSVREEQQLQGNMVEDFFALCLLYPLAITQIWEQIEHGREQRQPGRDIELGQRNLSNEAVDNMPNDQHITPHSKEYEAYHS